jgi:hypothetical protein
MRLIGLILYVSILWSGISLAEDSPPPRLVAPPPPSHSHTNRPPTPKPLASEPAGEGATLQTGARAGCPGGYEKTGKYCLKLPAIRGNEDGSKSRVCDDDYTLVDGHCLRNPIPADDRQGISCPPGHELIGGYCLKLPATLDNP